MYQNIYFWLKQQQQQQQQQQNNKNKEKQEDKKHKRLRKKRECLQKKLRGYDDIVREFAMCTFNLLDRTVNLFWLFI